MIKFYKFYKQDSTRQAKRIDKYYKRILDSPWRANHSNEKLAGKFARRGIVMPNAIATDSPSHELQKWLRVLNDSSTTDSLKNLAVAKVKALVVENAKGCPGFQYLFEKYQTGDSVKWQSLSAQVPGLDSLHALFNSSPEQLFVIAEKKVMEFVKDNEAFGKFGEQIAQADAFKSLPDQYRQQYELYTDTTFLLEQAKVKATTALTEHLFQKAEKIQAAQRKVSKLLSKYRAFDNSNDLSNAVRQTSMKGKAFWEHLVIGGNFNVVSTSPVSMDISPKLGIKITTRFVVGAGMNYRCTFGDSIKNSYYISPRNTSFKTFASYEVIKSFFAYAEWERSGIHMNSNDKNSKVWKDNYFIGAGKKFLIHPKLYLTLTGLYNLNSEEKNPVHPRRFQVRMGFQFSELATRKKKVFYDPNR